MWKNSKGNYQPSFYEWMVENLDDDDVTVLRKYGAESGIAGLTYDSDTTELFDRYPDIESIARSEGFLDTKRAKEAYDSDQFKTLAVWFVAEFYAYTRGYELSQAIENLACGDDEGEE